MRFTILVCIAVGGLAAGCASPLTERARNGITFYCPGAGNIDFGDAGVRQGLEAAGYRGQVATILWSVGFNPAIDQALRLNARLGAQKLADSIGAYLERYPEGSVNVVGLSAGTGVAIWALEELNPKYKVDNVILLASSLSHDYDVTKSLNAVKGKIYNYYSSRDIVLQGPMKIWGTIDFKLGVDGAGSVGLAAARNSDRVVNIPWTPAYERYGYVGGHTDSTSPAFVQAVLAPKLLHRDPPPQPVDGLTALAR